MEGFYDVDGVIRGLQKLREDQIKFKAAIKGEDPEAAFLESLTY